MQALETKLKDIIDNTRQYMIPLFQRPYSWKKSEWQALWDDILDLYDADMSRIHFMGSIVTSQILCPPFRKSIIGELPITEKLEEISLDGGREK